MQLGKPSQTALAAAFHRAAHQVLEQGQIFADPLALRILGADAQTVARQAGEKPSGRRMRLFIAVRTRFAEDALADGIERGVRQVVVLGAGLDTYAYRNPFGHRLRLFEVDYPATQAWKRRRLRDAAIPLPGSLTFVPVDFERQNLAERLAMAGFDRTQQTFFTWLGVVPYLNQDAVWSTLAFVASLPNGAHVVFDYSDPPASFAPERRASHEKRAGRVAGLGEPWVTYFEPEKLHAKLAALGFSEIEDLGPAQIVSRYFPGRAVSLPERGGHVIHATTNKSRSREVEELRSSADLRF
jgi:methyltransferase (TIGR00027 family)